MILSFIKNAKGATIIEFAIVAPVFFLIIFGFIECGRAYWTLSSLDFALGSAGRYAMLHQGASDSEISSEMNAHLYGIDSSKVTLTSSSSTVNGIKYLILRANMPFSFLPGFLPSNRSFVIARNLQVPVTKN